MSLLPDMSVAEVEAAVGVTRQAEAAPLLREVDIGDLQSSQPPPVRHAIELILPRDHVTTLPGHGGTGKSILALTMGAHTVCGRPFADLDVIQGPAVYVSLEDPAEICRYRLKRIAEAYKLNFAALASHMTLVDGTKGAVLATEINADGVRRLIPTGAMDEIRRFAEGASILVIDNASDAYDGDENNRRQVRTFIRWLAEIAAETGAAILLLAHIDKQAARFGANGNSYSGSTAWHNSVRSRIALTESDGVVILTHEKNNLGPRAADIRFTWTESGVLIPCDGDSLIELDTDDDAGLLAAIAAAEEADTAVANARTGPATTQHVLETFTELPQALRGKAGRPRFWAALQRLERAGKIGAVEYRDRHRNQRTKWALCVDSGACPKSPIPPANERTQARGGSSVRGSGASVRTNATGADGYREKRDGE